MNALTPLHTFDEIRSRSAAAVIGQSGLNHAGLAAEVRRRFSSASAADGALLQEPVVEAAPGYVEHEATLGDLAGSLIHSDTVEALDGGDDDRPGRYRFRKAWRPYAHQVAAWRKLADPSAANSVLVTSGTGSGKTECFLVPIIDDLVRQSQDGRLGEGVQAIVLYPLNALIASQEERLRDWTAPFGGRIRSALYNGLLRNEVKDKVAQVRPEIVADRRSLRASPPPILVTNVTMLEYMLLRPEDAPILAKSQGKLRYVVLDEAHSYIGARAAEIALLLRRVCLAFGTDPKDVRFVATSATIGGERGADEGGVRTDLARFLADVSGAPADRVTVIEGKHRWPVLPPMTRAGSLDPDLMRTGSEDALYDLLSAHRTVRPLLERLRDGPIAFRTLAEIAAKAEVETADLAAGLSRARKGEEALSPLRIHAFHRAVPGLWSCLDPGCGGAKPADWIFGPIAGDDGEACPSCRKPTFEVVVCTKCGESYLDIEETDGGRLRRPTRARPDDDYVLDAEAAGDADGEGDDEAEGEDDMSGGIRRLVFLSPGTRDGSTHLDIASMRVCDSPSSDRLTVRSAVRRPMQRCPACKATKGLEESDVIRSFRFGAPFLLANLVPSLLEGAAVAGHEGPREHAPPFDGHQLLSFTDSRQGTARIAAKLQIGAERNFVRSVIYLAAQDALSKGGGTPELDEEIATFERMIESDSSAAAYIGGLLQRKREQRDAARDAGSMGLPWPVMAQRLADRPEVEVYLRDIWSPRDPERFNNPTVLATFLLLREFARRPRRANSLETMGLARLRFAAIEKAKAPKAFVDFGGSDQDWRDYLDLLQTHVVRANLAVRMSWDDKRWVDPKTVLTKLVKKLDTDLQAGQRRWPSIPQGAGSLGRSSRAVKQLVAGFGLDHGDPAVRAGIQECLDKAWTDMSAVLSPPGAVDFALDFTMANVAPVTRAFICPVTGRFLDTAFRGLTPYANDVLGAPAVKAAPVEISRHPVPALDAHSGSDREMAVAEVAAWLVEDPGLRDLRERGAWGDLADRTALFSRYFRSAEHSAQQSPQRLRRYETLFKRGDINVLNCSTTMEMGVDIGSVSHVMMTNVPPSIASYRQRVGRAGRRRQAVSMAFTFCKDKPLDRMAFLEPIRFLGRTMRAPRVALDSRIIVQRHVNALLFSAFVHRRRSDALKAQVGPFFGCPSGAGAVEDNENGAVHFCAFVAAPSTREALRAEIDVLTRGSALDGDPTMFDVAAERMAEVREAFANEWRALQASRTKGQAKQGGDAANRGLSLRLRRLCEDYLLRVLSSRGFLPAHGFPSGVVPFVCRMNEPEAEAATDEAPKLKPYPQRQLEVAIREYSPGSEIVLDGLVHMSAGVTLNWRQPASEDAVREIQNLLWRWECKACGESGTTHSMDNNETCLACGAGHVGRFEYLEPAGFAADLREPPHADPDIVAYVPPREPSISLGGAPWTKLANPMLGRRRESRQGTVFFCNSGPSRAGYEVCLQCGRACPDMGKAELATSGHRPLFGKPDGAGGCIGADKPFGIKTQLHLGYEYATDVFEVQPVGIGDTGAGLAFAVALREALARRLGVSPDEMGVAARLRDKAVGGRVSAFVFDRSNGGSGFATQAGPLFDGLLSEMRGILDCKVEGCERGCPACVLSGDLIEDEARNLDRRRALEVVTELAAGGLPDAVDLAVPGARLVADVFDALSRARTADVTRTVLRLAAPIDVAALVTWSANPLFQRWRDGIGRVVLSVPPGTVASLDGTVVLAFRDWLSSCGLGLEEAAPVVFGNGAHALAEVATSATMTVLATRDVDMFAIGEAWGRVRDLPVVEFAIGERLPVGRDVPLDALRPPAGAKVRTIVRELDGSLRTFPKRMSDMLKTALAEAGVAEGRIVEVSYSDRYLNSPLAARMAVDTLVALTGAGPGKPVVLKLNVQDVKPKDRPPAWFRDDWASSLNRTAVLEAYAEKLGLHLSTTLGRLQHGREMTIRYADGRGARIYLDQGFGAWTTPSAPRYPFSETPGRQASAMATADFLVSSSGKTYVVAEVVQPAR